MKTLNDVLVAVAGRVEEQKLLQLRRKLEAAMQSNLAAVQMIDAIKIRRQLVMHLQSEGASRGIIQSYEQFYMGVVRRAALMGLIETPPEGPWSLSWQNILDNIGSQRRAKSTLRSLAAWATARGIEPESLSDAVLREWSSNTHEAIELIRSVLTRVRNLGQKPSVSRQMRLVMKASVGSVRDLADAYGVRRHSSERRRNKGNDGLP